jgi:cob(I)alamin adenosyltransferase
MPPFYTRSGDDGTTGILGRERLPKHHPRLETVGSLDEASAALGLARAACLERQTAAWLAEAQRDLYVLMAEVSASAENADRFPGLAPARLEWLEASIQELEVQVDLPREFILPGDSTAGAALSLARTIVRRAERRLAEWIDGGGNASLDSLRYLNRLSSLLFVLELWENRAAGKTTSHARQE